MWGWIKRLFQERPAPPVDVFYTRRAGAIVKRGQSIEMTLGPATVLAIHKAVEADMAREAPAEETLESQRPAVKRPRVRKL